MAVRKKVKKVKALAYKYEAPVDNVLLAFAKRNDTALISVGVALVAVAAGAYAYFT